VANVSRTSPGDFSCLTSVAKAYYETPSMKWDFDTVTFKISIMEIILRVLNCVRGRKRETFKFYSISGK
jgi:hypothetical protein